MLLLIFTPAPARSQWASNIDTSNKPNDLLERGILFKEQSKILTTENLFRPNFWLGFQLTTSL